MKRTENISITRGVIIFLLILTCISLIMYGISYYKTIKNIKNNIYNKMELSIYKKTKYNFNKIKIKDNKKIKLKKKLENEGNEVVAYFKYPYEKDKIIKVYMDKKDFKKIKSKKITDLKITFIFSLIANITISLILVGYILNPLRESIKITEEFIKDILHDINTPLSIIKINIRMLERKCPEEKKKIDRINNGINKIIFLQKNLKDYQLERQVIKQEIEIEKMIQEKKQLFEGIYPGIKIEIKIKEKIKIKTSEDIFSRILDNIISNACKYNKKNGYVEIKISKDYILIKDNGIGIKDTKKVFNRLYKETDRGTGIGMNIVKKMIDELGMSIEIKSEENIGTEIKINF